MEMQREEKAGGMIVNLSDLAYVLKMSQPTLRALIRDNPDFPVAKQGDKGDAYEFDLDAARKWVEQHAAAKDAAEAEHRRRLDQFRLDMYGETGEPEGGPALTPQQRKQLADAIRLEDYNRAKRGDLLERAEVEFVLRDALARLQKGLRQIGADFAREFGASREQRVALEGMVRRRTNELVDALQDLLATADDDADAA